MECPFCHPKPENVVYEDKFIRILLDNYPANPGHLLVVPKRHVTSIGNLTEDEKLALLKGIELAVKALKRALKADGFNVGINIGKAAGQTVDHIHIHVIPRYEGDCDYPEGGIRKAVLNFPDENLRNTKNRLSSKEIERIRRVLNGSE
ncbi:HIT family protein [Pyrococcus abyssi]|uniref:Histidine triad (HIT) protein n=1 Tax=Pyrococcus abyssi (strain GE5 / Orsay) TaxID=272844 RepID=Q9V017_PYRAB|nr:HIT family protein [Pyrococcus abyssi]CAB49889.1 Histidine triad (HIT) protein [Pyrococcus abyssi GE5]CCE70387.1 TPA: hit-like protein [Pyrococcus abyssi GE5]